MRSYLGDLRAEDADPQATWSKRFGALPVAAAFAEYVQRGSLPFYELPYTAPAAREPAVAKLSVAQAHLLWADLESGEAALRHARAALEDPASRADARLSLALAHWSGKRLDAALLEVEDGLREEPGSAALREAHLWLLRASPKSSVASETLAKAAQALEQVAATSSQFRLLAQYTLSAGDVCKALGVARRGVALDPECAYCARTLAQILTKTGRRAEAARVLGHALNQTHSHESAARLPLLEEWAALRDAPDDAIPACPDTEVAAHSGL